MPDIHTLSTINIDNLQNNKKISTCMRRCFEYHNNHTPNNNTSDICKRWCDFELCARANGLPINQSNK